MAIKSKYAGVATLCTKTSAGVDGTAIRILQATNRTFKVKILEPSAFFEEGQITIVPRSSVIFPSESA